MQQLWQRVRLIKWSLLVAMVGLVSVFLAGMKLQEAEHSQPAVLPEKASDDASVTLTSFEYHDVTEGRVRWDLRAVAARYFADTQRAVLSQINATFFLKDGRQVELRGDEGVLHRDTKNIEIKGNVSLSSADGYRLVTDRLAYDHDEQLLHTVAPVLLEGDGLTLKGQGMRLEIGNRSLRILNNIEAKLQGIVSLGEKRKNPL